MKKITLLIGLWLLPTLCLADDGKQQQKPEVQQKTEVQQQEPKPIQKPEVQQQGPQEGMPPRTLIIRVKLNEKGEEATEAEAVPSSFSKPVANNAQAIEAIKTIEKVEPITLNEKGGEGTPTRELQLMFDLQDLIACDPLNASDEVADQARWRTHHRSGFYGFGHRGHWGYRTPNRYANYGYWYNKLFYPYTHSGYSYPYGGYNYYYYYNPYYY